MDYELVIIGAGPAGCGAALYGAREGLTTLLLEPAAPGGQMSVTAWVENYPGVPGTSGPQLAEAMLAGAKAAGATFLQAQVTGLSLSGTPKTVETTAGTYTAGAVILAMGAAPENCPFPKPRASWAGACPTAPPVTACSSGAKPWPYWGAGTEPRPPPVAWPGCAAKST